MKRKNERGDLGGQEDKEADIIREMKVLIGREEVGGGEAVI